MTNFFARVLIVLSAGAATTAHCQDNTINMFASSSITNALDRIDVTFSARTGIKVAAQYDASSALIKQIEGGAHADAFVSANLMWMDYGVEKKLINERTRFDLLGNTLVLVAAKNSKINHVDIEPWFDLAKLAGDGQIATGNVTAVPVGLYAKTALEKLGVWSSVQSKIALEVSDTAAVARVVRGEARLGIVYATDAKTEHGIKIVGVFPRYTHDPIIYPAAATVNAKPNTMRYLEFLRSGAAKAIFESYGFLMLAKPAL